MFKVSINLKKTGHSNKNNMNLFDIRVIKWTISGNQILDPAESRPKRKK